MLDLVAFSPPPSSSLCEVPSLFLVEAAAAAPGGALVLMVLQVLGGQTCALTPDRCD